MSKTYAVTTDVPAGISSGMTFEDIEAASNHFGDAAYRTTAPTGTVVTLWEDDTVIDRATVTEESKAAYRDETNASLADIVARANARFNPEGDTR